MANINREEGKISAKKLTKKDVNKSYFLWYTLCEVSNSFERLQSLAFCSCLMPILRKLYTDKDDYSKALTRHLQFFNTEGIFGSVIHGSIIAMEEQKSNGEDVPDEIISGIKTGLMGPIAGIGDTITWGTIRPIIFGLATSFAVQGNVLGAIIPFLFTIITFFIGKKLWNIGYTLGKDSVRSILQGGWINELITGASILGLFMMGALSANVVKLVTPLTLNFSNSSIILQEVFDSIAPGILQLGTIFGVVWYFKNKGRNYMKILLMILAISLVGSLIGIL